jgi:hypothetical protein
VSLAVACALATAATGSPGKIAGSFRVRVTNPATAERDS